MTREARGNTYFALFKGELSVFAFGKDQSRELGSQYFYVETIDGEIKYLDK